MLYAGEPVHPPGTQRERQGRTAVPHRREPPRRGLLHRTGSFMPGNPFASRYKSALDAKRLPCG
ncbi:hypothetical protein QUB80_11480 [Chlorogloeopsis sp. ULAP01]|nr:hypothetical protein [Chlorogloeopsis sp. ULAP01]